MATRKRKTAREKWEQAHPGKPFPPPETAIVTAIVTYFRHRREVTLWRQNTGAAKLPAKGGHLRPVRFGPPGQPDIVGYVHPWGTYIGIEVKRPKPLSARLTPEQKRFGQMLIDAGGVWFVATSVDNAIEQFDGFYAVLEARHGAEKARQPCPTTKNPPP